MFRILFYEKRFESVDHSVVFNGCRLTCIKDNFMKNTWTILENINVMNRSHKYTGKVFNG